MVLGEISRVGFVAPLYRALVGGQIIHDDLQEGGFADAIGAHDRHAIAALQLQAKEKYLGQQMQTKDNTEYQAFGRQIKTCEKNISELEDKELELMLETDEQAEVIESAKGALAEAQKDLDAAIVAIDEREKNLQDRLDETQTLRDEVAGQIDEETLDQYERLFAKKGPSAVSGIEHAVCGNCHMKLPPQVIVDCKHGESVNFCPHCGVILYFTSNMVLEVAVDD